MIFDCLQGQVYRETIYEAYGKINNKKVDNQTVSEMIIFLSDYQSQKYTGEQCFKDFTEYQKIKGKKNV